MIKLTEEQIKKIRKERSKGIRCKTIAYAYGINPSQVSRIASGYSWKKYPGTLTKTKS